MTKLGEYNTTLSNTANGKPLHTLEFRIILKNWNEKLTINELEYLLSKNVRNNMRSTAASFFIQIYVTKSK